MSLSTNLFPKRMKLVLFTLRDSLLTENHLLSFNINNITKNIIIVMLI